MRGSPQAQPEFLAVLDLNGCGPAHHPLRALKRPIDAVLRKRSPRFEERSAKLGRPPIRPAPRLKARVWMALYSVRSERLFCEPPRYHRRWLGFRQRQFRPGSFHPSVFAKKSERVLSAEVARLFFAKADALWGPHGWAGDEQCFVVVAYHLLRTARLGLAAPR